MGAYDGLNTFFNNALYDYAKQYKYDESNLLILKGNLEELRKNHLQIYNNLLSCKHHSDKRTSLQYGKDLVASWVFEDFFLYEMQNSEFTIGLSGADRNRMILPNQKTSTTSDFIITSPNGICIKMELVNDYTGFWARNHTLHLRDNKYLQLQNNHSLLLAVTLTSYTRKYAIFDFRNKIPARYIPQHRPYGNKPAYELKITTNMMHDFSIDNVKKHILQIIIQEANNGKKR